MGAEDEDFLRINDRSNRRVRQFDQNGYCEKDSGGTCMLSPCDVSRGLTECSLRTKWRCECVEGYCLVKGRCRSSLLPLPTRQELNPLHCDLSTTDSCYVMPCNGDLGPTVCRNWQCECADNHCWRGGECVYSSYR